MMIRVLVFVHDHKFISDDLVRFYSEGKITNETFRRYLDISERVHVVCRARPGVIESSHSLISLSEVKFFPVSGERFWRVFSTGLVATTLATIKAISKADLGVLRLPSVLGLFSATFFIASGKPFIVEMVGDPREALLTSGRSTLLRRIIATVFSLLSRIVVGKAIGASYVTREALQSRYPNKGVVVSLSNVELIAHPRPVRCSRALNSTSVRIGLIGSFTNSYKGIDIAIRAIALLVEMGVEAELHVLGSGDVSSYQSLASSLGVAHRIHFDGVRAHGGGVYGWLDDLDVYIQPSRTEGLPRALVEAMSRGLPCVGTAVGGVPELLPSAYVVPVNDAAALARVLMSLVENEGLRMLASRENIRVANDFSASVLAKRRRQFLHRIAELV